jgi:hypothetical protein
MLDLSKSIFNFIGEPLSTVFWISPSRPLTSMSSSVLIFIDRSEILITNFLSKQKKDSNRAVIIFKVKNRGDSHCGKINPYLNFIAMQFRFYVTISTYIIVGVSRMVDVKKIILEVLSQIEGDAVSTVQLSKILTRVLNENLNVKPTSDSENIK